MGRRAGCCAVYLEHLAAVGSRTLPPGTVARDTDTSVWPSSCCGRLVLILIRLVDRSKRQERLRQTNRDLTFLWSFTGLTTSQSFPQERIQGMISSREFRVKDSSRLPSANSWICWLKCRFLSHTRCAARPEKLQNASRANIKRGARRSGLESKRTVCAAAEMLCQERGFFALRAILTAHSE